MGTPTGFSWVVRKSGDVVISHHGRTAATLRGTRADEVLALRQGCLDAVEFSGRQLWGPAAFAAYRLVLQAPPALAVATMLSATDRHTLGPLTEVIAQHHRWDELAGRVPPGPLAGTVAVERILRGDDLDDDPRAETHHLDVPARLLSWEGAAPVVEYRARDVLAPAPVPTPTGPETLAGDPGGPVDDPELVEAWEALVAPWARSLDGRVDVTVVDGPATAAVASLAPGAAVTPISLGDAVASMVWAGASGGSSVRRRGGAAGRSAAWWALRVLVDHEPNSPPDQLHDDLREWTWCSFGGVDEDGWTLRIAAAHPDGWSMAIDAHDPPPDDLVLEVDQDDEAPGDQPAPEVADDPWAALDRAIRDVTGRTRNTVDDPNEGTGDG